MPAFTPRELATVLAALRYWQGEMLGHLDADTSRAEASFPEHFYDDTPLTFDEVDALCERLNTEDSPHGGLVPPEQEDPQAWIGPRSPHPAPSGTHHPNTPSGHHPPHVRPRARSSSRPDVREG